jgi:plastocyanin
MKSQSRLKIILGLFVIALAVWFIRSREIPAPRPAITKKVRSDFSASINVNHSTPPPKIGIATRLESRNTSSINQVDLHSVAINQQETQAALNIGHHSQPKETLSPPNTTLVRSPANEHVTISGKVSIHGDLPSEKSLPLDTICSRAFEERFPGETPTTRFFVSEDGGLGDVLVSITGIDDQSTGVNALAHVIDQSGCQFSPYISACQTGQTIKITNSDPALHSVIATPRSEGNQAFAAAQLPGAPPLQTAFDESEEFLRFKCDVHPWMFSYVSVMDHPFYDVTSPDGSFAINNLRRGATSSRPSTAKRAR